MKRIELLIVAAVVASQAFINAPSIRADDAAKENAPKQAAPPEKSPPLPLHTIDGVGGVVITPIAYLVNPGPEGTKLGLPSISGTFVGAGQKDVESFVITETLWRRVELGYSLSRFGLGTFPEEVAQATGNALQVGRADVHLHSLNARVLALPENSFDLPLPSITVGGQLKINDGINTIDQNLSHAITAAGLHGDVGGDFVFTATKLFPKLGLGRPVILSGGFRVSDAAWGGYVGFSKDFHVTGEGNIVWLVTDRLGLAFEYRQYPDPYKTITVAGHQLLRSEDDWFTAGAAYVLNNHTTVTLGYGHFGALLNTVENTGWAVSAKYEF